MWTTLIHDPIALALRLIQAAKIRKASRILGISCVSYIQFPSERFADVGHGTGESLIVLLSHPSVPRPSSVNGITSLAAHHQRSEDRVARLKASLEGSVPECTLYCGDAVCNPVAAVDHPLSPSSSSEYDTILALDCAYHFNTRETFLQQSFDKLAPQGRVALADICFAPNALQSLRTKIITSIVTVLPKHNRVSTDEYVQQMKAIGFSDVIMEDITDQVFPGFVRFLKSRGWAWWVFGVVVERYAGAGARFVIVSGCKNSTAE